MFDSDIRRLEERLTRVEQRLDAISSALGVPAQTAIDSRGQAPGLQPGVVAAWTGREYRSSMTFLGLPLVHICTGVDPQTFRPRVAKGWIAVGNVAVGGLAIGGLAAGGITFGGLSLGILALGGLAIGGLALGGCAVGAIAVGGAACGYYALGGGAFGAHTIWANGQDPTAVEFFRRWVPGILDGLGRRGR